MCLFKTQAEGRIKTIMTPGLVDWCCYKTVLIVKGSGWMAVEITFKDPNLQPTIKDTNAHTAAPGAHGRDHPPLTSTNVKTLRRV